MKRFSIFLLILAAFVLQAQSPFSPYQTRNDFQLTSPGAMKFGLYGNDNPAMLSHLHEPDLFFTWSDAAPSKWDNPNHWGLFASIPNFGFGILQDKISGHSVTDYRFSLSTGNRTLSTGISYQWTKTDNAVLEKSSFATLGALYRPSEFLSGGVTYSSTFSTNGWETVGELDGRPFGNELLTVFGEYGLYRTPITNKDMWSAGVAVEVVSGIRITGRYFDNKSFTLGLQLSAGNLGIETQSRYDNNQKYANNTYGIRVGAYDRNIFDTYFPKKNKFVNVNLKGTVGYQRFMYFDNTHVLSNILEMIASAKNDPSVAGIAINTSGMAADKEKLWELRTSLKEFKFTGKKVFIFIDRVGIDGYHFASVADKIIIDPYGIVAIEGYAMGRTFLKGTLEKIGVGYDEFRFFKYKSAAESFSREKMSDADREQRQKLVDDWYLIAKNDICEARHLSSAQFDTLVNQEMTFMSQQAVVKGLVDTIGRWETVEELVKKEAQSTGTFISPSSLTKYHTPTDNRWSEPPSIAVIYALGACAMDEGITARSLVHTVTAAVNDPNIKGIVLRVDSPGGDPMASDYIAEALKKVKGKKPIIVSQGYVAASGGYWLSMYADTIVAAPNTITGSVGVIGGWFYNKGMKEYLGMSTDLVKAGAHADLGFGFSFPLLGFGLPDRNVTAEERARIEMLIKDLYKDFVGKVATGRKKSFSAVDSIAQGRVWSGIDGKQNGLVDVLGGLETAIAIAKEKAGIAKNQEVTIIEMPKKGLFDTNQLMPKLIGIETTIASDPTIDMIKFRLKHNGEPLPMLPLGDMEIK